MTPGDQHRQAIQEQPAAPTRGGDGTPDDEFIRLFGKHQAAIHSFLLGATLNHSDAEDLLQEINLALWRKRAGYDPSQPFLRWALGFARMEVAAHRRKQSKAKLVFSDEAVNALAAHWPDDPAHHQQRLEALSDCVQRLEESDRGLLAERYGSSAPAKNIADKRSVPVTAIYKALDRVRRALRSCVQRKIAQLSHPV